jgi:hypothetical protein
MGHDHISTTQAYSRPSHQSQWEGMRSLDRTRSARITDEGNVVLLPFPTTLAGHEQLTRAARDCGGCADKGNIAQHGRGCKFGMECLNCFYFRASVPDLPDLHRTRHRKAVALARAEARQTPRGLLGSATATKLKLEVERLDDIIGQLETEIATTDQLTDDQRQSIWDTLERMERVDRELLTPLGATRARFELSSTSARSIRSRQPRRKPPARSADDGRAHTCRSPNRRPLCGHREQPRA